jgi:hypothetical protein
MSPRYKNLRTQLAALRKHLLPKNFSDTGNYMFPDRVSVKALSYRVLSHAEIENFLEDRCVEIAKVALKSWKDHDHYSRTLISINLFSGQNFDHPPKTFLPTAKDQKDWSELTSPQKRIENSFQLYIRYVTKDNHGVREKNLTRMLIPVGCDIAKLDNGFISAVDAFGELRGDAAHTSAAGAVKIGVDPAGELKRVDDLMKGLSTLDGILDELLVEARPI